MKMNKQKLDKVFEEIKIKAELDYAITNTDEYGDCNTCVNDALIDEFGINSTGIYAKHWLEGMNARCPWEELDKLYIGHDITTKQANILIETFEANGYIIEPKIYNPRQAFNIKEEE